MHSAIIAAPQTSTLEVLEEANALNPTIAITVDCSAQQPEIGNDSTIAEHLHFLFLCLSS
jgi:hypothetical protein